MFMWGMQFRVQFGVQLGVVLGLDLQLWGLSWVAAIGNNCLEPTRIVPDWKAVNSTPWCCSNLHSNWVFPCSVPPGSILQASTCSKLQYILNYRPLKSEGYSNIMRGPPKDHPELHPKLIPPKCTPHMNMSPNISQHTVGCWLCSPHFYLQSYL